MVVGASSAVLFPKATIHEISSRHEASTWRSASPRHAGIQATIGMHASECAGRMEIHSARCRFRTARVSTWRPREAGGQRGIDLHGAVYNSCKLWQAAAPIHPRCRGHRSVRPCFFGFFGSIVHVAPILKDRMLAFILYTH